MKSHITRLADRKGDIGSTSKFKSFRVMQAGTYGRQLGGGRSGWQKWESDS